MEIQKTPMTLTAAVMTAMLIFAAVAYSIVHIGGWLDAASPVANAQESNLRIKEPTYATSVTLNDKQLNAVEVDVVGEHEFPMQKSAVGTDDSDTGAVFLAPGEIESNEVHGATVPDPRAARRR